jgi:prepilin-type N-terminal cleavage/methylation domain-containing protein
MSLRTSKIHPRAGFTLVEIMIAALLLGVITLTVMSSTTFASSVARVNSNAVAAKNIAQGFFERMAIDTFADVGANLYPDIPYPAEPYDPDDPNAVWLDRAQLIPCRIDFAFKGFGVLESGAASVLTDDQADWENDEWAGDTVFIVSGPGAGQFAGIAANSQHSLTLASALAFAPGAGSRFMINNGKTVEITTTWEYRGRQYTQTIESLVVNYRGDDNLGF